MTVSRKEARRGELWWVTLDERRPMVVLSTHGEDVGAIVVVPPFDPRPTLFHEAIVSATWEELDIGAEEGLSREAILTWIERAA
jgi:hypothetical protein